MLTKDDWLNVIAEHTESWPTNILLDSSVWSGLAESIAAAAEQDKAELQDENAGLYCEVGALREERDMSWQDADRLRAQVARMAEALRAVVGQHSAAATVEAKLKARKEGKEFVGKSQCNCPLCTGARQALSDAPEVLYSLDGEAQYDRKRSVLSIEGAKGTVEFHAGGPLRLNIGQEYQVIVLPREPHEYSAGECFSGHPEKPQESE